MAIEKSVTEIADSEDEPMTSSPGVVPDEAADKLCAIAGDPYQERQDALHGADGLHQASTKRDASAAQGLGVDRDGASADVDASRIDQTNIMLYDTTTAQEGAAVEVGSHDQGLQSPPQAPKAPPTTENTSDDSNMKAIQALPTTEFQFPENVSIRMRQAGAQPGTPKPNQLEPVEDIPGDFSTDPTAGHQDEHSSTRSITPTRPQQGVAESNHSTIADARSKMPDTSRQDSSSMSIVSNGPEKPACLLQDYAAHDGLGQKPTDEEHQAAWCNSADQDLNKNAVCPDQRSHFLLAHMQ
jgi:hypothetical protein